MTQETPPAEEGLGFFQATDLQDHLLTAINDLDRLHTLLHDTSEALLHGFQTSLEGLEQSRFALGSALPAPGTDQAALAQMDQALNQLRATMPALQFQDLSSQLILHTLQRLRACADNLAAQAFGDDGDGDAVITPPPLRPNPVTQDEMDAGSIELF